MFNKKKISIVSGCYNEEANVRELYERVKEQMDKYGEKYSYEQIIIDNNSTDATAEKLRLIASQDKNVKIILNTRNFGHIRSPYHAMMEASGDAVIYLASDLQDPPELISQFIGKWEEGYRVVIGVKNSSKEPRWLFFIRKMFYSLINKIADDNTVLVKNYTGFGLYDRKVIDIIREIDDPYPYFRGLVSEIGFEPFLIPFEQPRRLRGKTKNNFYTMYDNAMIGIVKHSKIPLRAMAFCGFIISILSMSLALCYLTYKLLFWDNFEMGMAPVAIGLFFFSSVQLFSIGILGEYVGAIYTRVNKKPLVVERERINF